MGGAAEASSDSNSLTPRSKWLAPQIPVAFAKQVEEYNRCRNLLREKLHPGCGGMNAELQCLEIEATRRGDDDFAVEHAACRQLGS